jgi:hypothetical protein
VKAFRGHPPPETFHANRTEVVRNLRVVIVVGLVMLTLTVQKILKQWGRSINMPGGSGLACSVSDRVLGLLKTPSVRWGSL